MRLIASLLSLIGLIECDLKGLFDTFSGPGGVDDGRLIVHSGMDELWAEEQSESVCVGVQVRFLNSNRVPVG